MLLQLKLKVYLPIPLGFLSGGVETTGGSTGGSTRGSTGGSTVAAAQPGVSYKGLIVENLFFDLQTTFFDGKTVFFRFLAEIRLGNAYKISSKSKFSTQNVQIAYHLHPALSYSLYSDLRQVPTAGVQARG